MCENCKAITNSNHLDVIEQDCATATGIDSVRELIEFCRYPPSSAKYKILILDEIQAMSKAGAQSLLKILEEPPSYVKFIFCTTEIKKILVTMLSRCSRFDLSRVKFEVLFNYLKLVVNKESGNIDDEALKLICKCSEGSVRDALSLLDRAILSSSKENILSLKTAQNIFGHFDKSELIKLIYYISNAQTEDALNVYKLMYEKGIDPKVFLNDFLEVLYYLKNINSINLNGKNFDLNDNEFNSLKELSNNLDSSTILVFWQFTINTLDELNIVSNQDIAIEMFILRLIYLKDIKNSDKQKLDDFKIEKVVNNNQDKANPSIIRNQLKNTSQQKKKKLENQIENNSNLIKSFKELIQICTEKKEFNLKYELETNVSLVSFHKNFIEIYFNEDLDKDFIKRLSSKLFEWTNERWIISLSKKKGEATIKEKEKQVTNTKIKAFSDTKEYNEITKIFNDIKIKEVDKKKI